LEAALEQFSKIAARLTKKPESKHLTDGRDLTIDLAEGS